MLEVKNITKKFDRNTVLSDITLSIAQGEIHGCVGVNSAGKTTLCRCMTGVIPVTTGCITLDGVSIYDNPASKTAIGYISSGYDYPQNATVKSVGRMFGNFYPEFSMITYRELLQRFSIMDAGYTAQMSTGERMRLSIALMLARKVQYLILDEPTLGLDVTARKELYALLMEKAENEQVGMLISSHQLDDLEPFCDTIHFLKAGKMVFQEGTDTLLRRFTKAEVVCTKQQAEQLFANKKMQKCAEAGNLYQLFAYGDEKRIGTVLDTLEIKEIHLLPVTLEDIFTYANKNEFSMDSEVVK